MAQLMGQDRGEFGFGVGRGDQPGMHADIPPGQCEGIDRTVFNGKELETESGGRGLGGQSPRQAVQVIDQFGIVEQRAGATDLAHDRFAQPPLGDGRQLITARIAQPRQLRGLRVHRGGPMRRQRKADQRDARP